eukprot:g949.t1
MFLTSTSASNSKLQITFPGTKECARRVILLEKKARLAKLDKPVVRKQVQDRCKAERDKLYAMGATAQWLEHLCLEVGAFYKPAGFNNLGNALNLCHAVQIYVEGKGAQPLTLTLSTKGKCCATEVERKRVEGLDKEIRALRYKLTLLYELKTKANATWAERGLETDIQSLTAQLKHAEATKDWEMRVVAADFTEHVATTAADFQPMNITRALALVKSKSRVRVAKLRRQLHQQTLEYWRKLSENGNSNSSAVKKAKAEVDRIESELALAETADRSNTMASVVESELSVLSERIKKEKAEKKIHQTYTEKEMESLEEHEKNLKTLLGKLKRAVDAPMQTEEQLAEAEKELNQAPWKEELQRRVSRLRKNRKDELDRESKLLHVIDKGTACAPCIARVLGVLQEAVNEEIGGDTLQEYMESYCKETLSLLPNTKVELTTGYPLDSRQSWSQTNVPVENEFVAHVEKVNADGVPTTLLEIEANLQENPGEKVEPRSSDRHRKSLIHSSNKKITHTVTLSDEEICSTMRLAVEGVRKSNNVITNDDEVARGRRSIVAFCKRTNGCVSVQGHPAPGPKDHCEECAAEVIAALPKARNTLESFHSLPLHVATKNEKKELKKNSKFQKKLEDFNFLEIIEEEKEPERPEMSIDARALSQVCIERLEPRWVTAKVNVMKTCDKAAIQSVAESVHFIENDQKRSEESKKVSQELRQAFGMCEVMGECTMEKINAVLPTKTKANLLLTNAKKNAALVMKKKRIEKAQKLLAEANEEYKKLTKDIDDEEKKAETVNNEIELLKKDALAQETVVKQKQAAAVLVSKKEIDLARKVAELRMKLSLLSEAIAKDEAKEKRELAGVESRAGAKRKVADDFLLEQMKKINTRLNEIRDSNYPESVITALSKELSKGSDVAVKHNDEVHRNIAALLSEKRKEIESVLKEKRQNLKEMQAKLDALEKKLSGIKEEMKRANADVVSSLEKAQNEHEKLQTSKENFDLIRKKMNDMEESLAMSLAKVKARESSLIELNAPLQNGESVFKGGEQFVISLVLQNLYPNDFKTKGQQGKLKKVLRKIFGLAGQHQSDLLKISKAQQINNSVDNTPAISVDITIEKEAGYTAKAAYHTLQTLLDNGGMHAALADAKFENVTPIIQGIKAVKVLNSENSKNGKHEQLSFLHRMNVGGCAVKAEDIFISDDQQNIRNHYAIGKVVNVNENGTVNVQFDDGEVQDDIELTFIKREAKKLCEYSPEAMDSEATCNAIEEVDVDACASVKQLGDAVACNAVVRQMKGSSQNSNEYKEGDRVHAIQGNGLYNSSRAFLKIDMNNGIKNVASTLSAQLEAFCLGHLSSRVIWKGEETQQQLRTKCIQVTDDIVNGPLSSSDKKDPLYRSEKFCKKLQEFLNVQPEAKENSVLTKSTNNLASAFSKSQIKLRGNKKTILNEKKIQLTKMSNDKIVEMETKYKARMSLMQNEQHMKAIQALLEEKKGPLRKWDHVPSAEELLGEKPLPNYGTPGYTLTPAQEFDMKRREAFAQRANGTGPKGNFDEDEFDFLKDSTGGTGGDGGVDFSTVVVPDGLLDKELPIIPKSNECDSIRVKCAPLGCPVLDDVCASLKHACDLKCLPKSVNERQCEDALRQFTVDAEILVNEYCKEGSAVVRLPHVFAHKPASEVDEKVAKKESGEKSMSNLKG